jgi:serine/threonine-protein kinase
MEYVPGESLYAILKRCREKQLMLPLGCVLRVQMSLLEALDYAHELCDENGSPLGVVHRDVTPSNVMVTLQGAIKLVDFGIARAATQVHHTEVGRVKGKGGYMAPEQCRSSKVDHRADIYGAGAVLYLMATGFKPFEHLPPGTDLLTLMTATMDGSFKRPSEVKRDVNPELERVILKAMALKPEDRYQTAGAMLEDLERFASSAGAFPSPRELGEFVKKLFPKQSEPSPEIVREASSSRATPMPPGMAPERHLATQDSPAPQAAVVESVVSDSTVMGDELADESTAANVQGTTALTSLPIAPWMLAAGGVALVLVGVLISVAFSGKKPPVSAPPPVPQIEVPRTAVAPPVVPAVPEVAKAAPAPEPVPVAAPAPEKTAARAPAKTAAPAPEKTVVAAADPAPNPAPAPVKKKPVVAKKPTGTLTLNAYPWAKVFIAGKEMGITPLKLDLPAGDYAVNLENPVVAVKRTVNLTVKERQETQHFEKMTP